MDFMFTKEIHDWNTWGQVFNSIDAFNGLIDEIFRIEGIKYSSIDNCTPGTNAVFKCDNMILKIFAPKESGMDTDCDYNTELYGIKRAIALGVSTPRLIAYGHINDKYMFHYIITEFIEGNSLSDKFDEGLTDNQKLNIGKKLRIITDKLNTYSDNFNSISIIDRALNCSRWSKFTDNFNAERKNFLSKYTIKNEVYVHGDLNPDNILITADEDIFIIDFADAVIAPREYELAVVICELFCFDKAYLRGYFGSNIDIDELTDKCLQGLLIHDFGSNIIIDNLGDIQSLDSISTLRQRIKQKLLA